MNILISGGTAGLGLELAKQFSQRGEHVFAFSRRPITGDAIGENVVVMQADVARRDQLHYLKNELAARQIVIDVIINNAGVSEISAPYRTPYFGKRWREIVATNVEGPLNLIELFLDDLMRSPSPTIINMTSVLAHYPAGFSAVYGGSKAFLSALSQSLSSIQMAKPIRVIEAVLPVLDTAMSKDFPAKAMKKLSPVLAAQQIIEGMDHCQTQIRVGDSQILLRLKRIIPGVIQRYIDQMSNHYIRNES